MEKGLSLRFGLKILSAVILGSWCIAAPSMAETVLKAAHGVKADVIMIDALKQFGRLSRAEVSFPHSRHTEALEKKGKDCAVCHLSDKDYEIMPKSLKTALAGIDPLSNKFKRLQDTGAKEIMEIYHQECIGCHVEMRKEGEKSGPEVCGDCHQKGMTPPDRMPMELNKSLHYRHTKALENKCETCHHEYDEWNKKLVYTKGKEASCRYCHREERVKDTLSFRESAHLSCISCHRKTKAAGNKTGPIKCEGCHDPEARAQIEVIKDPPRLDRKQPNIALITTGRTGSRMKATPFDHLAHEGYLDTCRVCHHADLAKCNTCHTPGGANEGKWVTLERSMHQLRVDRSCSGCHDQMQDNKNCAGCHGFRIKKQSENMNTCEHCHMYPISDTEPIADKESLVAEAGKLLRARPQTMGTYDSKDIPEKIIIKEMAERYDPVEFPHRKIVAALVKAIGDNQLAKYFHPDKGTVCQGCHHNSPISKTPPRCMNCHGKPFDAENLFRPGRMAAYHIQCMNCHKEMGIEKPSGCTDCHKAR